MGKRFSLPPFLQTLAGKRWLRPVLYALVVLVVVAGFLAYVWVETMPDRLDDQQTLIIGPDHFVPDSDAAIRVVVQEVTGGRPISNAKVKIKLKPDSGRARTLFEGRTGEDGSLPVQFHVPADAPARAELVVETSSGAGRDRVVQPVTIERDYRLLLSSDKPLYQPGQTIHMRALALSTFDLTAAQGVPVDFLVEDAKGNKVFRQTVSTSDFGVAAVDFVLADMVNQGDYKLSVTIGGDGESAGPRGRAEKTVEVRPYVLPKFAVAVSTDRTFYLPGERVEGVVQADYFFGKPVAGSQVQVVGSVWDVERTVMVDLRGQTDENGTYAFSFDLPTYFAGSGLDAGQAQFALEVTVIDQTEHAEQTSQILPVAAQPLLIEAVAESGALKPGVENIVYLLTAYPDGRPAQTRLYVRVDGGAATELSTGPYGLAEFRFTPQAGASHVLSIQAQDEAGRQATHTVEFARAGGGDNVLLRADRAAYLVGETMHLVVFTPVESGSVYLDIVRAGQTLSTRSAKVAEGRAEFVIDVGPDLYGTLELHAYKVLGDGTIVRDTRMVVVDAPNELSIAVSADRDIYRPGDVATVDLRTTEGNDPGVGVQTVLGLAIVDESVFALQRQDPGFAKLYFLLEQELLEPFYQTKFGGLLSLPSTPPDPGVTREAQDVAARATWAGVAGTAGSAVNSRPSKIEQLRAAQQAGFEHLGQAGVIGMITIPLLLGGVALLALHQAGVLGKALKRLGIVVGIFLLSGVCALGWLQGFVHHYIDVEPFLVMLPVLFALGLLIFAGYAWVKGGTGAKLVSLLTLAWIGLFVLLVLVENYGRGIGGAWYGGLVISALFIPAAYVLLGQGLWLQERRFGGGVATVVGALPALPVILMLVSALAGPQIQDVFGTVYNSLDGGVPMPLAAPAPPLERAPQAEKDVGRSAGEEVGEKEAPRLRQYFPETLYWAPEVLTDEDGRVSLEIPMADSITTWRLTALASSQDGRLGFTTRGVRVFQDFFVDVDLPVALTQGDEISIPIGVFNYLPEAQEVRLVVEPEPWFELLGPSERTLTIASNDIEVVYFPIRVLQFGRQGFQVTAWGEEMSDAVRREVRVVPDGKEIRLSESDWLRESREVPVPVPAQAVAGTARVEVKIYPGVMAQVVEGLEKILRLPHG